MMRLLFKIVAVAAVLSGLMTGERGNIVYHFDKDGDLKVILSSQGNCRHHLTSHPNDYVLGATPGVQFNAPSACN
jgi:hypothetical protein